MNSLRGCPAPAKLNLFLHVVGRRADGYHLLQSAFRLIDWADVLDFRLREDGELRRTNNIAGVLAEDDLCLRAARLLQQRTGTHHGAEITLHKHLPMGSGLGGGSSDAATTLLALNRLWQTGLKRAELCALGLELGADVPFFLFGRDALVEGVGEQFTALELPSASYWIVHPGVEVSTAEIFSAPELTRNTLPIKIADFVNCAAGFDSLRNDLQPVAIARYPQVASALRWLSQAPFFTQGLSLSEARMTGSGSSVFARVEGCADKDLTLPGVPSGWQQQVVRSLPQHPLRDWVKD